MFETDIWGQVRDQLLGIGAGQQQQGRIHQALMQQQRMASPAGMGGFDPGTEIIRLQKEVTAHLNRIEELEAELRQVKSHSRLTYTPGRWIS